MPPTTPLGRAARVFPVARSTIVTGALAELRKPSSWPSASENWLGAQLSGEQAAPTAALGSRTAATARTSARRVMPSDTSSGPREVPTTYGPRGRSASYSRRVAERAWIKGAQQGSVADLERLFREHWPRAFRAAQLVTGDAAAAEDIAQEAFLAAIRNLDRFDRRRPFAPWLHRIVVNRAIDWTRARKLRGEVELGDHYAAPPAARARGRRARADRRPAARAPRRRRPPLRARVHAGRDRGAARPAARHRQLATAPRPRPDERGDVRPPEEERAWEVVRRAYEERTPQPRHARSRVADPGARRPRGRDRRGRALAARPRRLRARARGGRSRARRPGALLAARARKAARRLDRRRRRLARSRQRLQAPPRPVRGRAVVAARALRRGDDPQPPARPRRGRSRALGARARAARRCRAGRAR